MQNLLSSSRVTRGLCAALCLLSAVGGQPATAEDGAAARELSPVTIEDVLATEYFGRAEFSADGRWLAYNQVPPYASLSDFSYWLRAGGLSGHQLWVMDLNSGRGPFLQPGLDPGASNFLFGMSPDSQYVILLEYADGMLRLVACRIGQDACIRFDQMPDIRDRYVSAVQWNERMAWIAPDRLVMPVRRPDLPGSEMRNRAAAARFLWSAWHDAWAGKVATSTVAVSTGADRSSDWAEGELAVFDLRKGEARNLASGRHAGATASPDGRHVLAARVAERSRPVAEGSVRPRDTHPMFDRRYALQLFDLETGNVRALDMPFSVDPGSLTWRADSRAFAAFGWRQGEAPERGHFYLFEYPDYEPVVLGRDGFEPATAVPDPAGRWWTGVAPAAFVSDRLAVHGSERPGAPAGWQLLGPDGAITRLSELLEVSDSRIAGVGGGSVAVATNNAVYSLVPGRLPARIGGAGTLRPFSYTPDPAYGLSGETFPMPSLSPPNLGAGLVLLVSDTPDLVSGVVFAQADGGGGPPLRVSLPESGGRVLAASGPAAAIAAVFKSGAASRLVLVREGQVPTELARINDHLNQIRHPGRRWISYELHAGAVSRRLDACMLLPPDFDPSETYPVLMELYPSGAGGECLTLKDIPSASPLVADLWASRGFVYVRPAFPLDLARAGRDPLGGLGALVDQTISALGEEGYVDTSRVALYGFSQGGAASLAAATRSRRAAAIISVNGWADYFSHYFGARGLMRYFHLDQNGGDNRWRYECLEKGATHGCPFGFGLPAYASPAAFARASPVARAAQVSAPVLLVHSDFDYFDMAQYEEMFGALYRAGKEATFVRYWGEGHGPSSPANIRDLWTRIDMFLSSHGILRETAPPEP